MPHGATYQPLPLLPDYEIPSLNICLTDRRRHVGPRFRRHRAQAGRSDRRGIDRPRRCICRGRHTRGDDDLYCIVGHVGSQMVALLAHGRGLCRRSRASARRGQADRALHRRRYGLCNRRKRPQPLLLDYQLCQPHPRPRVCHTVARAGLRPHAPRLQRQGRGTRGILALRTPRGGRPRPRSKLQHPRVRRR